MRMILATALATAAIAGSALAQMSVSTFGSSDASLCYRDAAGGYSTGTDDCDRALAGQLSERDRIATLVNRGVVLNRAGRYDDAIRDYNAALERDSATPEAWLNRGNSLLLQNKPDAAIADYEAALENGLPDAHIAWHNIGLAYYAKADLVKARQAFRKALEIMPGFKDSEDKLGELQGKRGENDSQ